MILNRNLSVLFLCQLIAVAATTMMITIGGIVGARLAPSPALATLPLSLGVIGTALTTVPAAMLMKTIGRRWGFALAALIAAGAASLAAFALHLSSFVWFSVASCLFGFNLAFVQQYRFAAAESVAPAQVSKAVSLVLLGAIGGAYLGPELATRGRDWLAGAEYVGSMLSVTGMYLMASMLFLAMREPRGADSDDRSDPPRRLRRIAMQPTFIVAVIAGTVAYGVMVLVMTATPLSMHVLQGHSLEDTAWVIRSHALAMYLPSLISGFLIVRWGTVRMMLFGTLGLIAALTFGYQGQELMHYWLTLVLLGLGWNFLFVAGTTMLTHSYRDAERFKSQAVNEFSIFGVSAAASLLTGTILYFLGWPVLMLLALPVLLAVLPALWWIRGDPLLRRAEAT